MAIDKAVNQAPMGIDEMMAQGVNMEPDIEIEIEDPEEVTINAGGLEIVLDPDDMADDEEFGANLAEEMEEEQLSMLVGELVEDFEEDHNSRRDWMQTYVDGLELLGMKVEDRTEPWPGACGVYHPLLSEALVKFQSETMMETFPAQGPVKTKVIGKETPRRGMINCVACASRAISSNSPSLTGGSRMFGKYRPLGWKYSYRSPALMMKSSNSSLSWT